MNVKDTTGSLLFKGVLVQLGNYNLKTPRFCFALTYPTLTESVRSYCFRTLCWSFIDLQVQYNG